MVLLQNHAFKLIFFQHKVRRGGHHAVDGGEFLRYKRRQRAHGSGLNFQHQVISAAHQIYRRHLVKAVDALGDGVETPVALGRDLDLDDRLDLLDGGLIPVDQRGVAHDDPLFFQMPNGFGHGLLGHAQHHGGPFGRNARVLIEQVQHADFFLCKRHVFPSHKSNLV